MNKHIEEYLDFYLSLEAPKYAVLIDGEWGSGKTYFIQSFFKKRPIRKVIKKIIDGSVITWLDSTGKHEKSYIYISLNGVSTTRDIEVEIFRQLYPILSDEKARLSGKLLSDLIKTSLKIELSSLSEVQKLLINTDNKVLVFDDLERAKISMKEALGYINYFVEHEGQKVILVGNVNKIEKDELLKDTKEKLVGKTFYIEPLFENAFNNFLEELSDDETILLLKLNKEEIKVIFFESGCNNLRLLRYGILEFKAFFLGVKSLYEKSVNNEELISDFIKIFFMFTFELGSGNIDKSSFDKIKDVVVGVANQNDPTDIDIHLLTQKYNGVNFRELIFSYRFWQTFFVDGKLNIKEFKEVEKNPKYFLEVKPLWYQLWDIYELSDPDLKDLLSRLEIKKQSFDFSSVEEIIHIVGTLIELNELNIYSKEDEEIIQDYIAQIEKFVEQNESKFLSNKLKVDDTLMGSQVRSYGKPEFKAFINKVEEIVNQGLINANSEKVMGLFELLELDIEKYKTEVIKYELSRNLNLPFFSIWDLEEMINLLKRKSPKERRDIIFSIRNRIKELEVTIEDKIWVEKLVSKIIEEFEFKGKSIENFSMSESVKFLEAALENHQK